jgi:3-phenylpropionate/trans-cinnamate dioxygenase ferredoxin subunit
MVKVGAGAAGMEDDMWVATMDESQLQDGTVHLVSPGGLSIILIKKDARIFALRNRCAHMSCTLAGGRVDGYTLQCPCHEWKFDITTGEFIAAREIKVQTYLCKSQDGKIHVRLEEPR